MAANHDWIFWLVGGIFGAIAVWMCYISLFKDRSRGKPRCPKCWYDMSGAPVNSRTCSECGYTAKRERKLFKTRRRWRFAACAVLVAILSVGAIVAPSVQRDGWVAPLPTTVLILLSPAPHDVPRLRGLFITGAGGGGGGGPTANNWREEVFIELARRIRNESLWAWQWRWMVHRHWNNQGPPWTFTMITRGKWPRDQQAFAYPVITRTDYGYLGLNYRLLRFRIEGGGGGGSPARNCAFHVHPMVIGLSQPTDPWTDPALAVNGTSTTFRLSVDRQTQRGDWQCIWKDTAEVFIVRDDDPSNALTADANNHLTRQLIESMTFKVEPEALHVRWSNVRHALPFPTLAIDFELLRDGDPIATARAWWTAQTNVGATGGATGGGNGGASIVGPNAIPFHYRVMWDKPIPADAIQSASGSTWKLRIASNQDLAMRDVESFVFWDGSFEIPQHWEMASRNWINAKPVH